MSFKIIVTLVLTLAFSICYTGALAAEQLQVVATTSDIASITRAIGGDRVAVQSLNDGTRDPHFLQAQPTYIVQARNADLFIRIGMELEVGYEPVILDASRNARIAVGKQGHLDLSANVVKLEVPTQKVDRSMGDVHAMGNPHYWLDPYNGRIMAWDIAGQLSRLDPEGTAIYAKNLAGFNRRLDEAMFGVQALEAIGGDRLWVALLQGELERLLQEKQIVAGGWFGLLAPFKGQGVISQHRSWNYLLNRFGLKLTAEMEPKPGIPPGPQHLMDVVETVRRENVKVIMVEPFYGTTAADYVASRTGAQVIVCANATGGTPEATDYLGMLDHAIRSLAGVLGAQPPINPVRP
ncbi:MAG: metal ABC transporter substrate-binding protein [Planctomycetota bacterium]